MVGHFLSSDIIASRFWHDHNLKPDVRMLQVLKMKATAFVFEPGRNCPRLTLLLMYYIVACLKIRTITVITLNKQHKATRMWLWQS